MTDPKTPQAPQEEDVDKLLQAIAEAPDYDLDMDGDVVRVVTLDRESRDYVLSHIRSLQAKLEASEAQNKKMKESRGDRISRVAKNIIALVGAEPNGIVFHKDGMTQNEVVGRIQKMIEEVVSLPTS